MSDLQDFKAESYLNEVPSKSFGLLPAGKYVMQVVKTEWKETEKAGKFLTFELDVLSGEYRERKLWKRIMLNHSSEKVKTIARGQLSELMLCCNKMNAKDTSELVEVPVIAKVVVKKAKDQYPESNEIQFFEKWTAEAAEKLEATTATTNTDMPF